MIKLMKAEHVAASLYVKLYDFKQEEMNAKVLELLEAMGGPNRVAYKYIENKLRVDAYEATTNEEYREFKDHNDRVHLALKFAKDKENN